MVDTAGDIEQFLLSHEVPPDIIQNFTTNGITVNMLMHQLSPDLLKELCPHIGSRIKISEIITANALTESISNNSVEIDTFAERRERSPERKERSPERRERSPERRERSESEEGTAEEIKVIITRCFPDFDLKTLLQTSIGGNSILKFYETYSSLNNNKRNQLTDIIIKHIYTHIVNHKISYEEYNFIAAKIISLFPRESIGTYFTNPVPKRKSISGRPVAARGKLVDKVRNLLYKYGERKRPSLLSQDEEPTKKAKSSSMTEENQDILWLKSNRDPWDEVVNKWKASYLTRKNAKYENIHDFYVQWPILNDPRSESLISIDFDLQYPENGLNFYLNCGRILVNRRPQPSLPPLTSPPCPCTPQAWSQLRGRPIVVVTNLKTPNLITCL